MRKTIFLLLTFVLVLGVAACGGDDDTTAGGTDSGADDGTGDDEAPDDGASDDTEEGDDPFGTATWQLATGTVDGEALALIDTHPITLAVQGDQIGGTAACNSYGGDITVEGDSVSFGALFQTEMACIPEAVNFLEQAYLAALGRVTTATSEADQLVLTGEGVDLRFTAQVPEADAALTGTTWTLESLIQGEGVSSTIVGTEATLVLGEDGSVAGSTGCNTITGSADISGGTLADAVLATTRVACRDEAESSQEQQILAVLNGTPTLTVEGMNLSILLPDGSGLVYRAG